MVRFSSFGCPSPTSAERCSPADGSAYRSELDRPDRRLWAITFVVVHRFPKTRRFSSSLGVAHPPARGAYTACCIFWGRLRAPASPGPSGRKTAARLLLRQSPAEGGGCACFSEFLPLVRSSESLLLPDLRFLTTKDGLHKLPPLATRFSVTQIAKAVKTMYLGGVLRPQKPTSTCAPPIHVPLQRRGPPSAPPCCFPELRANLRDIPSEGR